MLRVFRGSTSEIQPLRRFLAPKMVVGNLVVMAAPVVTSLQKWLPLDSGGGVVPGHEKLSSKQTQQAKWIHTLGMHMVTNANDGNQDADNDDNWVEDVLLLNKVQENYTRVLHGLKKLPFTSAELEKLQPQFNYLTDGTFWLCFGDPVDLPAINSPSWDSESLTSTKTKKKKKKKLKKYVLSAPPMTSKLAADADFTEPNESNESCRSRFFNGTSALAASRWPPAEPCFPKIFSASFPAFLL